MPLPIRQDPLPSTMYVSVDGDAIGQRVGRARLTDDVAEVRRVDAAIRAGNDAVTSWAINSGGSTIESGGDEVAVEVPVAGLAGLEGVRAAYAKIVGATLSVGVGPKLSMSSKALLAAKLRGKDRTVYYAPEIEREIAQARGKEADEYLKSEGIAKAGTAEPPPAPPSQADPPRHRPRPAPSHAEAEAGFHAAAQRQADADRAADTRQSAGVDEAKAEVVAALGALKEQLPVLQQVRQAYPKAYAAVIELTDATIALARGLDQAVSGLAKAEAPPRIYRAGALRVPSAAHAQRSGFDAEIRRAAAARWAPGGALDEVLADVEPLLPRGRRGLDPRRVAAYREMIAAGDVPPPVVLDHDGTVLENGEHAAAAAVEGLQRVPALMRRPPPGLLPEIAAPAPAQDPLDKSKGWEPPHRAVKVAPGTAVNGEVFVHHSSGRNSWRKVGSGMIAGTDPAPSAFSDTTHPVSALRPNST